MHLSLYNWSLHACSAIDAVHMIIACQLVIASSIVCVSLKVVKPHLEVCCNESLLVELPLFTNKALEDYYSPIETQAFPLGHGAWLLKTSIIYKKSTVLLI